jgi:plastocyanin
VFGCGGSYTAPPLGPDGRGSAPGDAIVIDIRGMNGALSFSPNPATIAAGKTVVWHNVDGTTHHVVLDDGELDTGTVRPGAYSDPMGLVAPGPYHCTIHPEMVLRSRGARDSG